MSSSEYTIDDLVKLALELREKQKRILSRVEEITKRYDWRILELERQCRDLERRVQQ